MKIVLIKDVEGIGKANEQKNVADGFARNFLIPNRLAEPATSLNIQKAEKITQQQREKKEEMLKQVQKNAEKIDGEEFIFKMRTQGNVLFGSIDKNTIVKKISELGVEIGESSIELEKPIKEIGEFQIKIFLNHGIEATVKIVVERE